ncbi:MAG: hypothetical protein JNM68_16335 [Dinghuibacter sp.]|nr:hypothetical protein [Dinghuibacter sp.]
MTKQDAHIAVQCARINKKQYRSLNPFRFFRSILSVVISGSSVVEYGRTYKRKY